MNVRLYKRNKSVEFNGIDSISVDYKGKLIMRLIDKKRGDEIIEKSFKT